MEIGFKNGISQKQREIVINMLKKELSIDLISDVTGLSIKDINELKKKL